MLKTLADRLAVEKHVEPDKLANKLAATPCHDVVGEALVDRTG